MTAQQDSQGGPRAPSYRSFLQVAVAALLLLLAVAGLKSYRDLATVRQEAQRLEQEIAEAKGRLGDLSHRLRLLESDPLTLESIAREDLGMVRPEDVVIVLPEDEPQATEPSPTEPPT